MSYKMTFGLLCFVICCVRLQAQDGWQRKHTPIFTKWATQVSPANALIEYPRPQMARKNWTNLNGLWDYKVVSSGTEMPNSYDGKILVPFPIESALSGVQKPLTPGQELWYHRTFTAPTRSLSDRILLHFGAVDWKASVYINGTLATEHEGGYQNFTVDITPYLKEGRNNLSIKVYDPTDAGPNPHGKQTLSPQGINYTATSGIWQTVWLEVVDKSHIDHLVLTPDIDRQRLGVGVITTSKEDNLEVELVASVEGKTISTVSGPANAVFSLSVANQHLWSPGDPFLYDLKVRLKKAGKIVDEVSSYFGMRKVEVKKDGHGIDRIFLNNQVTFNLGVLDQGFWPDGLYTAPTDEALAWDIRAIKAMGFNTIRKHIKVEPARWYYHCDKLGMLVWQDMVNPSNTKSAGRERFERESEEIVNQLYNFPCITTWVLFNEGWNTYDQARLTGWLKNADPSRIVDGHTGENLYAESPQDVNEKWKNSDLTDIHAYPDPKMPDRLNGKAMALGEFGGIGVSVEDHVWDDIAGWGYVNVQVDSLEAQYKRMMDTLARYKAAGLSASIYTEPFDVEGEQNGLITYDRRIIKIPLSRLKEINAGVLRMEGRPSATEKALAIETAKIVDQDSLYNIRQLAYRSSVKDSLLLRRLALMALNRKDSLLATTVSNEYIHHVKNLYAKENLAFVNKMVITPGSAGFDIFKNDYQRVDSVLGKDVAEEKVMDIIYLAEIRPYTSDTSKVPDWDEIERRVVAKYGTLGEEKVFGTRMIYLDQKGDWNAFGKAYKAYFSKYGSRFHSDIYMNNFAWHVFENISDTSILLEALKWSKVVAEDEGSVARSAAMDTHANLLYKLGKRVEAIDWEELALSIEPGNPGYKEALDKMRSGQKTW